MFGGAGASFGRLGMTARGGAILRNVTPANTSRLLTMLARVKANSGNGLVVCQLDSKTQGRTYETAWPAQWAALMNAIDPSVPFLLNSFLGDNNSGPAIETYRQDVDVGSGWSAISNGLGGHYWDNSTTTNALSWTPGFAFDTVKIYWIRGVGYDTVTMDVDGATIDTFSMAGAGNYLNRTASASGSASSVINVKRTGVGTNARVTQIEAWDSARSIVKVWNGGIGGAVIGTANLTTNPWSNRTALIAAAPDVVIIDPGTNDMGVTDPTTFEATLQSFITAVSAVSDIILVRTVDRNPATVAYTVQTPIVDKVATLAYANALPLLDLRDLFGPYSANVANYDDNTHLNATGDGRVADIHSRAWRAIPGVRSVLPAA